MAPTIVFDLDGTLALGRGPVIAYARSIGEAMGERSFVTDAMLALEAFEAGGLKARDGYDVVGTLAGERGVPAEVVSGAYLRSREVLGTPDAPVSAPAGLADFISRLDADTRLVLATNAPPSGVPELLEEWGVADRFAETNYTVGKPGGLRGIIGRALQSGPVLSIGDIAEFDLAPAAALGAATALVGPTAATSTASVTMRGETVADLYEAIESWVASAR